jgi:hypothetical protein
MKDCPYCGKENVKYNHKYTCKDRPKGEPEGEEPATEVLELKVVPKNSIPCLICGEPSIRLNAIDIQCPKCGDYDTLAIKNKR